MARVWISTDNGVSFNSVYADTNETVLGFTRFDQQRMILRRQPLYITSLLNRYTTNGGSSWQFETGISYEDNLFKTGDWRAIAIKNTAEVSFLSDYGKTKFVLSTSIPAKLVNSLCAPSDSIAFIVSDNGYIFKLHTKNRTMLDWQRPVNLDLNYIDMKNSFGVVACDRGFLLYTTNSGDNWQLLRTVSENKLIQEHFADDSTAYALDESGGIIKIGFSNVTDTRENGEFANPASYSLEQNYPNPFNNSTVINYAVPTDGYLRIAVYDITDTEVAEVARGFHRTGTYRADFNAATISSGVYFYVLESESVRIARKLILMR